jgi:hypothetical protein
MRGDYWVDSLAIRIQELHCVEVVFIFFRWLRCHSVGASSYTPDLLQEYIQICHFVSNLLGCKAFRVLIASLSNFYRLYAPFWTAKEGHCWRWDPSRITFFRKDVSEVLFYGLPDNLGPHHHVPYFKLLWTELSLQRLKGPLQTFNYLILNQCVAFKLFLAKRLDQLLFAYFPVEGIC